MPNAVDGDFVHRNQGELIVHLGFFDINELIDIRPNQGSVYIQSTSEPHNEEQEFDFQRLSQWLNFFNLTSVGFKMAGDPPKPEFIRGFHTSGHLSQNDLIKVIDEINPDKIIPIHTQHPEWFTDHFDNVTHVKNGVPIDLS